MTWDGQLKLSVSVFPHAFLRTQSKGVVRVWEEKLELLSSSLCLVVFGSEAFRSKWKLLVCQSKRPGLAFSVLVGLSAMAYPGLRWL